MSADKVSDKVNDVEQENRVHSHNPGQPNFFNTNVNCADEIKVSKHELMVVETSSIQFWFIEQVDESKLALSHVKARHVERDQTLAELRNTIAVLPSPESVKRRLAEQANLQERQRNEIIETERERLVRMLAEQQELARSAQWTTAAIHWRSEIEIQRAKAAADEREK